MPKIDLSVNAVMLVNPNTYVKFYKTWAFFINTEEGLKAPITLQAMAGPSDGTGYLLINNQYVSTYDLEDATNDGYGQMVQ